MWQCLNIGLGELFLYGMYHRNLLTLLCGSVLGSATRSCAALLVDGCT